MSRQFTDEDREKAKITRENNKKNKTSNFTLMPVTASNDALNQLEVQMAQQLRIMNMHRMMRDLSTPAAPMQQQLSGMSDLVKVFKELNGIKAEIRNEVDEEEGDYAPESMEDKMIMQLLPALLQKKQVDNPTSVPANNMMKSFPNLSEQQIKTMIKSGMLSKEQAKQYVKDAGLNISDEEFEQKWRELSL